jgi:hypothetical protein
LFHLIPAAAEESQRMTPLWIMRFQQPEKLALLTHWWRLNVKKSKVPWSWTFHKVSFLKLSQLWYSYTTNIKDAWNFAVLQFHSYVKT